MEADEIGGGLFILVRGDGFIPSQPLVSGPTPQSGPGMNRVLRIRLGRLITEKKGKAAFVT